MRNLLQADIYKRRSLAGLRKITVRQKFSNHTLAFLDYRIESRRDYLLPPENALVQARWGRGTTFSTSYGYVNHYETVMDDQDRALTRMVTVGTSKPMNAVSPASWQGQTRSSVVRDIAAKHRLRSIVHDHPYVLENWATGTRSDFQALKALADETGYRLWVDGATVWFLDPLRLLQTASNMSTPTIPRHAIRSLTVMGGSNIPGEMVSATRRVQFGLDYRTNEFFEATSGDPTLPTEVATETVTTFSDAQDVADAVDRKQGEYYVLKASFDGNADVQPGTLVRFDSGRVNNDQGGLWLVGEATHEVSPTEYVTSIVATRGADQRPLPRAVSTVRGASGITQAVVRDGLTWEAALQERAHA